MLIIKYISFEDHQDFNDFELQNDEYFNLAVNLLVGNELGSDIYYFDLVSDYRESSDIKVIEHNDIYFREKGIFVTKVFNKYSLFDFIKNLVEKNTYNKNSNEQSNNLSKYFHWEFDNYVPYID
ncbi:Imm8 family immunity protein [Psychrobacter sp. BF1]|uniref:Imm8 family immunity protein n=1 Tax=Psychrobacter sp. BF1 TaxID=2821147 RepID=UPI001C4E056C|nr:Imm8 family immunity protein [Psychrobacter sp. BF1]